MASTRQPGQVGNAQVGGKQFRAVVIGKDGSDLLVRLFADEPDSDTVAGVNPSGFAISPTPMAAVDALTADNQFAALHEPWAIVDTEAGLAAYAADAENWRDARIAVRNAGSWGRKYFYLTSELVPRLLPSSTLGPTIELLDETPSTYAVPAGTDEVLGDVNLSPALARVRRFPGDDAGSPFEAIIWLYGAPDSLPAGVLAAVPLGQTRFLLSVFVANVDAAKWEFVLQRQPGGAGGWVDAAALTVFDYTPAGVEVIKQSTETGFPRTVSVANPADRFRVVVRHDDAAARSITLNATQLLANTISVTP